MDEDEPPRKLHRVTFELEIYVMAINAEDARQAAQECMPEDLSNAGCWVDAEIPSLASIPQELRESLPWNSDDDRTVEQIIQGEA
jgi:hypothetical protein